MPQLLKPLLDRLLVLQDWGPEKHPGSDMLIPQPLREKQRPSTGVIAAVGPGRRYEDGQIYPPALQKGQRVMFAPAETLTKVEHDGQEHLMMREQDVFLVLSELQAQQEPGKGIKAPAFCISNPAFNAENTAIAVAVDTADAQTTLPPKKGDKICFYNGLEAFVALENNEVSGLQCLFIAFSGNQIALLEAAEFHAKNRVPIAIVGYVPTGFLALKAE